jgi:hypothetical protein
MEGDQGSGIGGVHSEGLERCLDDGVRGRYGTFAWLVVGDPA